MPGVSTCGACGLRIEGYPPREGDEPFHVHADGGCRHARCMDVSTKVTGRDAQVIALKAASPNRAPAFRYISDQEDAGHLPLFRAANEPSLF